MGHRVIVIGDCVLDEYIRLRAKHTNQEKGYRNQPVPQYDIVGVLKRLGGACNVAHLLQNRLVDFDVTFYTTLPLTLQPLLEAPFDVQHTFNANPMGKLSVKRRYIDHEFNHMLSRHDYYKPMSACSNKDVLDWVRTINFGDADIVVISDYMKGLVCKEVANHIIANAKAVVVDTKNPDVDMYIGADYIKLNHQEFINIHEFYGMDDVAEHLVDHKLIVTCGSDDTRYIHSQLEDNEVKGYDIRIPTKKVDPNHILDAVGCGDAFVAGFVWGLLQNDSIPHAIDEGHFMANQSLYKLGAIW